MKSHLAMIFFFFINKNMFYLKQCSLIIFLFWSVLLLYFYDIFSGWIIFMHFFGNHFCVYISHHYFQKLIHIIILKNRFLHSVKSLLSCIAVKKILSVIYTYLNVIYYVLFLKKFPSIFIVDISWAYFPYFAPFRWQSSNFFQ